MPDNNGGLKIAKKRKRTTIFAQSNVLNRLVGRLPGEEDEYKIVSYSDLTPLGFLSFVAGQTVIRNLDIVTFRVGPTALKTLNVLAGRGRICQARIVVGKIMERDDRKTSAVKYWEDLCSVCARYHWTCVSRNNHAKLLLMDTDAGKYVLEGSGNFNDAPNFEQYSFTKDDKLYQFYSDCIDSMVAERGLDQMAQVNASSCKAVPVWSDAKLEF